MSVSKLLPSGGVNDFNLSLSGSYTSVTFTKEYSAGGYSIVSAAPDNTMDIYIFAADGSSAGYTNSKSLSATKPFNKIVIVGGTSSDLLTFSYKLTFVTSSESAATAAGPVIASVSPTALPKINDSTTITGRNFNAALTVKFTGTDSIVRNAKSVTVGTSTSAIAVRPDDFPITASPYTVTVSNSAAGVEDPVGSNSHILPASITAGVAPEWVTGATLPAYTKSVSYSTTLVATDADAGSAITYSLVSGSLPSDFTLTSTSGVVSGTTTSSTPASFTVRATDAGGTYVDRAFTMPNAGPTWVTSSGALPSALINGSYSTTLVATDDSGATPAFTLISGSLPTGLTLTSTSGVISGTPTTAVASSFTVRATDGNGSVADRSFTLTVGLGTVNNISVASGGSHDSIGLTYPNYSGSASTAISTKKVMICGGGSGNNTNGPSRTVYTFDTSTNTWTQVANMPGDKSAHGLAVVGATAYAWGGHTSTPASSYYGGSYEYRNGSGGGTVTGALYAYNIAANTWSTKASMPVSLSSCYGVASGTKVYAFGGGNEGYGAVSKDIYVYDTVAESWSTLSNKFENFSSGISWATSNKTGIMYGWGGFYSSNASATCTSAAPLWSFNPSTNVLTKISSQPDSTVTTNSHTPTAWFPGNGNDGYVFFMGGQYGSDNYTKYYDISANFWQSTSISTMRSSAFYSNNNANMTTYPTQNSVPVAIFFGGYNATNSDTHNEKFVPSTGTGTYSVLPTTFGA